MELLIIRISTAECYNLQRSPSDRFIQQGGSWYGTRYTRATAREETADLQAPLLGALDSCPCCPLRHLCVYSYRPPHIKEPGYQSRNRHHIDDLIDCCWHYSCLTWPLVSLLTVVPFQTFSYQIRVITVHSSNSKLPSQAGRIQKLLHHFGFEAGCIVFSHAPYCILQQPLSLSRYMDPL